MAKNSFNESPAAVFANERAMSEPGSVEPIATTIRCRTTGSAIVTISGAVGPTLENNQLRGTILAQRPVLTSAYNDAIESVST